MSKTFRISVPTKDVDEFTTVCIAAGWAVLDTGERIATDDGEDAESVLVLTLMTTAQESPRIAIPL